MCPTAPYFSKISATRTYYSLPVSGEPVSRAQADIKFLGNSVFALQRTYSKHLRIAMTQCYDRDGDLGAWRLQPPEILTTWFTKQTPMRSNLPTTFFLKPLTICFKFSRYTAI